jgi:predicted ATPase
LDNLRHDLVVLRKALGSEAGRIQSPTRDTLILALEDIDVDVFRFDQAIRAGDTKSLRAAVDLHTGALLEGCYEEWALPERETRAWQCLDALEALAAQAQECGEYEEAIRSLRRASALDPVRDSTVRRLMACLEASGDPSAAGEVYRVFRRRLQEELGASPDARTTTLFQQIRARARATAHVTVRPPDVPTPSESPPPFLASVCPPHSLEPLIGRESEVLAIQERLTQSRLVTLVGAGGVGKTRLAMEAATRLGGDLYGEAVWVEFAPLTEGATLLPALAAALGLRPEGLSNAEALWGGLVGRLSRGEFLLVLDNCEQVLDAAAQVAHRLLSGCRNLHILATSRQRLGLTGEVVWRVPSLSFPPEPERKGAGTSFPTDGPLDYPAVRLFVERAAAVRADFRLVTSEDVEAVCRICRRLDGIPLAIELAAARVQVLPVSLIASRLDDRFHLLTGGSRAAAPRHQTLQALIDWSYEQLLESERLVLRRLSIFAGGWSLEAAEAINGVGHPVLGGLAPLDTLDLLASLIDRSLVLVEGTPDVLRYRMQETVREYGRERLRESGEEGSVRERHADHFLMLAEQAVPFLEANDPAWLDRLETDHDNLRAAITYFASQEKTVEKAERMAAALAIFWDLRGHFYERHLWLVGLALRPTPPTKARAHLLSRAAWAVGSDGDFAATKRLFLELLEIQRRLGDRRGIAAALNSLAQLLNEPVARSEYDPVAARPLAEESLAIMRELGDLGGMAQSLYTLGHMARRAGDHDQARRLWQECCALDLEMGVKSGHVVPALGDLALESGNTREAQGHYEIFLSDRSRIGDPWGVGWGLQGLGAVAQAQGRSEHAARLLGASIALRESSVGPLSEDARAPYEALRTALRQVLGEAALDAAWTEGAAMTLPQAAAYALNSQA